MNNKSRINELKRRSKITNLCNRWIENGVSISISDFLEVQETIYLQEKILLNLDEIDHKNLSYIYGKQDVNIVSIFISFMKNYININEKYVFFIKEVAKLGGLVLDGKTIIENYEFILNESEYFHQGCSIFFCTVSGESGVCLWKGEYDLRIYVW